MMDTPARLTVRVVLHQPDAGSTRSSSTARGKPPYAVLLPVVTAGLALLAWYWLQPVQDSAQARPNTVLPSINTAAPVVASSPKPVPQEVSASIPSSDTSATVITKRAVDSPADISSDTNATSPQPAQLASPSISTSAVTRLHSSQVERFELAAGVRDREPVGTLASLLVAGRDDAAVKIYSFSDVRDMQGQTLVYRWLLNDQLQAEIPVQIGAARWRSSSSKNIGQNMRGSWRVELHTRRGELLADTVFEYQGSSKH